MKPSSATKRAELMKKLSSNPRFKEAKKSGRGYVIPGAKPSATTSHRREGVKEPGR